MCLPYLLLLSLICLMPHLDAQDLPFKEIPPSPEDYSPGNIMARMVEGLGYRYYWATEGLRAEDLDYRPTPEARSCRETLDHVYNLSQTIMYNALGEVIQRDNSSDKPFDEVRRHTLTHLDRAAKALRGKSQSEIVELRIYFREGSEGVPFWNMINGPIADAIYHCGQVVSFRRSSGNPINPNVNVFRGKNRE